MARCIFEKPVHQKRFDRYAAFGRLEPGGSDMHEDGAATVARTAGEIPVEDETDIVKPVVAEHAFVAGGKGKAYRVIIGGMMMVVAPAVGRADRVQSREGGLERQPVAPEIAAQDGVSASGRCAIAFAFDDGDSGTAQRAGIDSRADLEQAAMRIIAGRAPDDPALGPCPGQLSRTGIFTMFWPDHWSDCPRGLQSAPD